MNKSTFEIFGLLHNNLVSHWVWEKMVSHCVIPTLKHREEVWWSGSLWWISWWLAKVTGILNQAQQKTENSRPKAQLQPNMTFAQLKLAAPPLPQGQGLVAHVVWEAELGSESFQSRDLLCDVSWQWDSDHRWLKMDHRNAEQTAVLWFTKEVKPKNFSYNSPLRCKYLPYYLLYLVDRRVDFCCKIYQAVLVLSRQKGGK